MSGGSKSPGKRVSVQRDPARPDLLYAKKYGIQLKPYQTRDRKRVEKINFEMAETKDSDILVAGIPVKLGRFLKGKKCMTTMRMIQLLFH